MEYIITPIKAFVYKGFICYMTRREMLPEVLDGGTTTSGYIIVRYLNINEYMRMEEVIEKIKSGKKQNEVEDNLYIFDQVPQLGRDVDLAIDKMEITFNSYFSFWNSTSAPRNPKKYVEDQLKEIIDMYYAQIN